MMAQGFQTGDVVQLKSGGPAMTIKQWIVDGPYSEQYQCQWFGGKKLESGFFRPESLKRFEVDGK